jgi:ribosome biogenesis GTPase
LSAIDLTSLGWDDYFARSFTPYAETHTPGRVARVDRGAVTALTATGPVRAAVDPDQQPTVGDWVALADEPPSVDALLPRRSAITRGSAAGTSTTQVLAANVDVVFVALTLTTPKLGLVERLVTLVWESGATPVVLLTKADLAPGSDTVVADVAASVPGVDVHPISSLTGDGIGAIASYIGTTRTIAVLGQSGVGKSTLVNRLVGADVLSTGAIRDDGKGRHTTTHRELVPLPTGGVLIDTPGLRGVALTDAAGGLERTFADVEQLTEQCYFTDCAHQTEPGCAVLAALSDGSLAQRRFDSWHKLRREAHWMATRTDARLAAEQRRKWKVVHKEVRRSGRIRP